MVDTVYGKVRIRAWPKKRGRPRSAATMMQNARFASAQRLAKTAPYQLVNRLIDATKGTGLYPRDLLTQQILAPRFTIIEEDSQEVSFRRAQVRSITMQGFLLRLDGTNAAPSFTDTYPVWPVPIIDTADFWNVSQPDRITIPEGVTAMMFFAGVLFSSNPDYTASINRNLDGSNNDIIISPDSNQAATLSGGLVPVTAGEQWGLRVRPTTGQTLQPAGTFFSGVIAGTDF